MQKILRYAYDAVLFTLTDILPVLKSSVNLKQTLTVHTSHFSEVMFSRTNLPWRSQGLPGWASRPPGSGVTLLLKGARGQGMVRCLID